MARKSTETVAITLRIREELRRKLEGAAKRNDVSLNAEMANRLEASFELPERLRRRLEHEAAQQGHSMNAEIVRRLDLSFWSLDRETTRQIAQAILASLEVDVVNAMIEIVNEPKDATYKRLQEDSK
jgi:predicted HicB family RNase H-like nuclease